MTKSGATPSDYVTSLYSQVKTLAVSDNAKNNLKAGIDFLNENFKWIFEKDGTLKSKSHVAEITGVSKDKVFAGDIPNYITMNVLINQLNNADNLNLDNSLKPYKEILLKLQDEFNSGTGRSKEEESNLQSAINIVKQIEMSFNDVEKIKNAIGSKEANNEDISYFLNLMTKLNVPIDNNAEITIKGNQYNLQQTLDQYKIQKHKYFNDNNEQNTAALRSKVEDDVEAQIYGEYQSDQMRAAEEGLSDNERSEIKAEVDRLFNLSVQNRKGTYSDEQRQQDRQRLENKIKAVTVMKKFLHQKRLRLQFKLLRMQSLII